MVTSWFCSAFILPQHGVTSVIPTDVTLLSELKIEDKSENGILVRTGNHNGHAPEVFDYRRSMKKLKSSFRC